MTETRPSTSRDHYNDFDLDSPEFNDEYVDVIDDLAQHCPVAKSNVGNGYYVVNRQEDARRISKDWETFSSTKGVFPDRPEGLPPFLLLESDPPYHNRWRTAVNRHFSLGVARSLEGAISAHINYLIDQFIERGECDFVAEFAAILPGRVFLSEYMGVPIKDVPLFLETMDDALFGPIEGRMPGWHALWGYIDSYLRRRRQEEPRGDFIDTVLIGVELDGGAPCPWEDKVSVVLDILTGAMVTSPHLLSGIVYHLATHPADRARLITDPAVHDRATEEFLRWYASTVAAARTVREEVEVGGQTFKVGDWVLLNLAAACRDPRAYDNPKDVDIARDFSVSAVFGFGPHHCIGSHLARLEGKLVMQEVLRRIPDFVLAPGAEITYETGLFRWMNNLPLVFEPGRRQCAMC